MNKIIRNTLLVLCFMLLCLIPTYAEDSKVAIAFPLNKEDRFTYELTVKGNGTLYEGQTKVRDGIMEYELSVGESKVFEIKPDNGYEVKKIVSNGVEQDKNQLTMTLQGVSKKSTMLIEFQKKQEEIIVDPIKPNQNHNSSQVNNSLNTSQNNDNSKQDKENITDSNNEDITTNDTTSKDNKNSSNIFSNISNTISHVTATIIKIVQDNPLISYPLIILVIFGIIFTIYIKFKGKR